MTSSNRTQVVSVKEVTVGTTPSSPRMRARRTSGEGLKWVPTFEDSGEIRADGMNAPPIKTGEDSNGDIKFELSYPVAGSPLETDIESAMHNAFANTPVRDNDGTADSVITALATTGTIATVTTGPAFAVGHLVRFTGFGIAGNNGVFRTTTASATVPAFVGSGITDETVPPAAARMKVVGFAGVAGDITATATGLASTTLDFTTLGLIPGQWLKLGGTAAGDKFAITPANNDWARISGPITATAIPLDNRPSGWGVDAGTGKTIKVWFGDQVKNGTTQIGQSIEKGFLGQAVPTYIAQPGMVVSKLSMDWTAKTKITGDVTYMGMTGAAQGTVPLDAAPDAATSLTSYPVMACSANVGRIGEAGAALTAPNFVKSLAFSIDNTLTAIDDITTIGAAGIGSHSRNVTGTLNTYFGDNTLLTKYFAGALTSINARVAKGNMAVIVQFPQVTYNSDGSPNAGAMNQDVMLNLGFKASKDETVTNAMVLMDRLEYVEA